MRRAYLDLAVLFVCSIVFPCLVHAQATGSILGNVVDASGGAIPGATVTIIGTGANTPCALTTDSTGRFVANLLQLGNDRVKVTAQVSRKQTKPASYPKLKEARKLVSLWRRRP